MTNTDPYDDDDDSPTLQRPPTASSHMPSSVARGATDATDTTFPAFVEESSTDTDLAPLDVLADAHTVDALPPAEAVETIDAGEDVDVLDYGDMETPKIPLDVAAALLRASQEDERKS